MKKAHPHKRAVEAVERKEKIRLGRPWWRKRDRTAVDGPLGRRHITKPK